MFVVLSELNCLKNLNNRGVYPDAFYTDIELFRQHAISFRDATILIIFGGNNQFSKKHAIELTKSLLNRIKAKDGGIKHCFVVSDVTISGLSSYYKYENNLSSLKVMKGWNAVGEGEFLWDLIKGEPKECKIYLSAYDRFDKEEILKKYSERTYPMDRYIPLISVPDLKTMLESS